MDKFFSIFGKTVGILLIAVGLIGGGIYLGQKYFPQKPATTLAISPTPVSSMSATISPTLFTTASQQQTDPHVAIYGGGVSSFSKYLMSGFKSWTKTVEHTSASDKLTLTLGDYQLTILQAAVGGEGCIFPGETPSDMSVVLSNPVSEIELLSGKILKRGQADSRTNPGKETDQICEQFLLQPGTGSKYDTLTEFGVITYVTPLNRDADTVVQMDAMVGSLQKQ